jgi:two-component system chemotaxis sensor kinase CheA
LSGAGAGAAGSLIVAGQATELIDLEFYWRGIGGAPALADAAPSPPKANDRRILVVDQSPFTRLLLGPLLAQAGYGVDVAASAQDALTLHDGGAVFDLILADTSPGAPGARQLAQTLGQASSWHATPLLGLGAYRMDAKDRTDSLAADLDRDRLLDDLDDNLMRGAA